MSIVEYPDRDLLAIGLADALASELKNCLLVHPWASFVVPGGTTPGPIFDNLCAADVDWSRVHVMLSDERWVPEDHERSNAKLLKEHLFQSRAAAAKFVPFYIEGQTPEEAAPVLSEQLAEEMPISILLLGMGADMHTASLFPGAVGLAEMLADDAPLVVPVSVEGQEPRISFSGPALAGAMAKHLVIYGAEKRDALERAESLDVTQAPIKAVMSSLTVHWAE
ncbi:6-phosphogluconolactonase [Tateyamaria sp. ANG-S1]|uniref:6-phosphogluconolactonase n=1 Tax=Tateyamaria sp. ANG-S1 TaxID=1577905 RepID=UPI00057DDF8E|nr:6-phosphogluconolactonase [Tateyamaria sp. ANG-S1]KIC48741.1 6-phosphogluconolactonase [Tateyamaria sp. ANG-S1]